MIHRGHPLRKWLAANELTAAEFAAQLGVHQSYINHVIAGIRRPAGLIERICKATRGQIKPRDFK